MPTKVLVTSDDKKGRDSVAKFRAWYDQFGFTQESAQTLNEAAGFKEYVMKGFKRFSASKHPSASPIEQYFLEVLGYKLDLSGVSFPEKDGFGTYMAVPQDLNEDEIIKHLAAYFKVAPYVWVSPATEKIDRTCEQKRPSSLYVFAHRDGDEPDQEHFGKSYDDATREKMLFLSAKEYLLTTGFHRWIKQHFMDAKGWTRTSSLWSSGHLVGGYWNPSNNLSNRGLYLDFGNPVHQKDGVGPRELFLG